MGVIRVGKNTLAVDTLFWTSIMTQLLWLRWLHTLKKLECDTPLYLET
jgi:hypothetical protein